LAGGEPARAAAARQSDDGAQPAKEAAVKSAFIRDGELWVAEAGKERQLSFGAKAHKPLWSADGTWIAYTAGDNTIRLIQPSSNQTVELGEGTNYQWSPKANLLAFLDDELLQVSDASKASADKFENASIGVGNYSWLPDGSGFLVSSPARLLPDGWSDILLYKVPYAYGQADGGKPERIARIPNPNQTFFAVTTGNFEWSADRKRVRFIAKPTASLSADSNTLCVMTWEGGKIKPVGEMVSRDRWAVWAPKSGKLAYIGGAGRDATVNKRLIVTRSPYREGRAYTPDGYVDADPAWESDDRIIVSRSISRQPQGGTVSADPSALPHLVAVSVRDGASTAITTPSEVFGDYSPTYWPASGQLAWIRSDGQKAAVWLGRSDGSDAREWVAAIDMAPDYYGQMSWGEVVDLFEP
jgi:Tol biopolymer transport system component